MPTRSPSFSWLDLKLAMRMMRKHPGTSLAIVLALSIGIPVSLLPNHLIGRAFGQSPPLPQGERVVGLVGVDKDGRAPLRVGDYELLRDRAKSFATLGAAVPTAANVVTADGWSEGSPAALVTASVFTLSRVRPMTGRALVAADEVAGAADVAVISNAFWQRRLGGADGVVGSTLRVAGVPTTIVGVMPDGFAMPSSEQIWLPLRARSSDDAKGLGPAVRIYGRLADGVSAAQAEAEVKSIQLSTVPDVRPNPIQAQVVVFSAVDNPEPEGTLGWVLLGIAQVVPIAVLLIACGNVAILILARTATREGEMAIRTVLGASRARIVGQLFVETLLLAFIATGIGLIGINAATPVVVGWINSHVQLPFWFDPSISLAFVLKAFGVSVLCAVVAGVLPALRATGGRLQLTLQSSSGGRTTLRLGRLAGALIVIEVAIAVSALFIGIMAWHLAQPRTDEHTKLAGADRYLIASIRIPSDGREVGEVGSDPALQGSDPTSPDPTRPTRPASEALRVRLATLQDTLGRLLRQQPGVRAWTFSDQPPGEERDERLAGVATFVDPGFFGMLDLAPVAGRLLNASDISRDPASEPTAVVVNMKFLERGGTPLESAIGKRFSLDDRATAPQKEIVGVVPNFEPSADRVLADGTPVVFMAATPGNLNPMTVTVDLGSRPLAFASTLRSLVAEADPGALISDVYALDQIPMTVNPIRIVSGLLTGLSILAMALAGSGLYALMSMTATRRRREFGIRLALGGTPRGVMVTVARRALVQIGLGLTLGVGLWLLLMSSVLKPDPGTEAAKMRAPWPYALVAAAAVVVIVALVSALGPTLRYVRMRPAETLRME